MDSRRGWPSLVQGSRFFIIRHIHNHTSIISSEMQVELKKNTAFTWGKGGEKNNPQTMLLGEYSVRTGKTPQQHKSTYTRHSHRGNESGPASSHLIPQPLIGAGQTRLTRPADRSEQRRMVGGGGNVCNVCRVGEERKSVSLHCTPGVYSSNSLAKATVGEPEKDKIVLSLGRVNIPIFAGYSLSILVSILINFPL